MTIQARPAPLHPPIESWTDLQGWIDRRLTNIEHDLDDDETAAAMGLRLRERRAVYLDLAFAIRDAVAREQAERQQEAHEDSVEQQYKAAYGDEPLTPWQAEGR